MFKTFFKKIILGMVSFQLILGNSFLYAEPISSKERTNEMISDFIKSAAPSDLPFVDYLDNFYHDKIQPVKKFDLSSYIGKQIYVGYGIFDQDQKYCKYIEKPGLDPTHNSSDKITTYFTKISSFNQHQYAISKNKMTFQECQDKVDHFGGYIAVPTSSGENAFLTSKFSGDKWLGIAKDSCSEDDYMNQEGKVQEFFYWSQTENTNCDPNKLKVKQNTRGKWQKQGGSELNYCVIEVNSEDINRPVKLCAPWWRIERDYKKEEPTTYGGINVYRINQADIPAQSVVCTKMDTQALQEQAETGKTRRITCTEYYDATLKPECLHDPMQKQCFVDECSGYIKNACVHVQEITPLKDYTKTKALVDGTVQWIHGKVHIRTEVFDCPPSPPSLKKNCKETSTVIIYPKECPGSKCQELKECVYNASTKEEKTHCYDTYKCQKIYGSPDLPVYDANGNLIQLKGYCTDENGHNIEPALLFDINIQSKKERKCLEYEEYNITKHINQNCTLERPYNDYTVDMSLTGEDIYENNPNCIRLNNLMDARPIQELALNYKSNGFARTVIKKAFINGDQEVAVEDGVGDYVMTPDQFRNSQTTDSKPQDIQADTSTVDCSDFTQDWLTDIHDKLLSGSAIISSSSTTDYIAPNAMRMKFTNVLKEEDCVAYKDQYNCNSYEFDEARKTCHIYFTKRSEDRKFRYMKGADPTDFISETEIEKDECRRYATCLGGNWNESDYNSGGNKLCKLTIGSDYEAPESEPTLEPNEDPKECKPPVSEGSLLTQFDGNRDIFSIQEVVDGPFGYYSNHTTWNFIDNIVTYEDKQLFPIKPVSTIDDPLVYEGVFKQISILTKKPNILAGAVGGSAAGGAAAYAAISSTGIGLIAVAAFVLVAAIFGPKKKYNEQYNYWIVYKMVPVERYIDNIYGYDFRIIEKNDNGTRKVYDGNKYKLIYAEFGKDPRVNGYKESFTGTLEPGDFKVMINNWFKNKKQLLMCFGWPANSVPHDSIETQVVVGYPKCKWYQWSCDKRNDTVRTPVTNPFIKQMTNYYKGAVNTVTIFVPYIGDYEVKAYDKHDNLLGDVIIYESEFLGAANGLATNAQVMFGLKMDRAEGINEGNNNNACRYDLMVEWGGGVSGIYYENDFTGLYSGCQKSNDYYVQDHSATKITVQSLGEDKPFVIYLEKPLPFANRVFLTTLGEKEVRKYRCYDEFGECEDSDYVTEGEE